MSLFFNLNAAAGDNGGAEANREKNYNEIWNQIWELFEKVAANEQSRKIFSNIVGKLFFN